MPPFEGRLGGYIYGRGTLNDNQSLANGKSVVQSDRNIVRCRLFYLFLFMTLRHLRSSRTLFSFMHI